LIKQEIFLISGNKVSIVSTKDNNIIVGVVSHDKNIHDSKTLTVAISHANSNRVMNRFCSYLWVFELILVDKTRNLFDKFQTGYVWESLRCNSLMSLLAMALRRVKAFLALE
jgi:hypothetical protein